MKNYICINGNKTELTEEQLKQLGIELPKANLFEMKEDESFYFITTYGAVIETTANINRKAKHSVANYCTDEAIMQQRALHETLDRLLWRYSMMHDGDKIDWNNSSQEKFEIDFTHYKDKDVFEVSAYSITQNICSVYFATEKTAFDAIKEIVKPFIAAHPNFKF
jgi:hypothetical protein